MPHDGWMSSKMDIDLYFIDITSCRDTWIRNQPRRVHLTFFGRSAASLAPRLDYGVAPPKESHKAEKHVETEGTLSQLLWLTYILASSLLYRYVLRELGAQEEGGGIRSLLGAALSLSTVFPTFKQHLKNSLDQEYE